MPIAIIGDGGTVAEVDSTAQRALHVTPRLGGQRFFGSYGVALATGIMAAGFSSGATMWAFRWTDRTRLAVVHRVTFGAIIGGTAFTAGAFSFNLVFMRTYLTGPSGGTAATIPTNNAKLRTIYGSTLAADIRISSTTNLTTGSGSADNQGFAGLHGAVGTTSGLTMIEPGTPFITPQQHPAILAYNEGLLITATVPATGTWSAAVGVQWSEVTEW